jgi:hypothetical protein
MSNDMFNGLLEFSGSIFILNHCYAMFRAKDSSAVSLLATLFFFVWGIWNLHWFRFIQMPYSLYAGICMAAANALWLCMIIYYRIKNEKGLIK